MSEAAQALETRKIMNRCAFVLVGMRSHASAFCASRLARPQDTSQEDYTTILNVAPICRPGQGHFVEFAGSLTFGPQRANPAAFRIIMRCLFVLVGAVFCRSISRLHEPPYKPPA